MPNPDDHGSNEPGAFAARVAAVLDGWASLHAPPRLTVAFSGGLDSTVLLSTLCRVRAPAPIRAAHVDHGLNPRSAEWSEHCARVAADHGVEFAGARIAVDRESGEGLEAAAREARYAALRDLLVPGEWLLTAHHADDQLETVLLRMLRGTGIRGLRGIIGFGPFGEGWLGRPLLGFTREELCGEARARRLTWIDDPSNSEARHDRNYLRLRVLPALKERWPAAAQQAARLAEQANEAEQLLEAVAAEEARALAAPWHVPRATLAALDPKRQRNLLRHLLREVGLETPSARKLDELRSALLQAHPESHAHVRWPGGEGRIYREALHLLAPLPPASPPGFTAQLGAGETWAGPEGRLALEPARDEHGLPQSWLERGLTLRFRSGGERFRPRGRDHHHSLKALFQESGVVPWMRDRVPLLYRGDELAAIGDLWLSADVDAAPASEPRWRVRWTEHPAALAPEPR